jgi:hypothetical protein
MIQDMLRRSIAVAVECGDPFGKLVSLGSQGILNTCCEDRKC